MPRGILVVTPCGGSKQPQPARAVDLYTGSFVRECLRVARLMVAGDDRAVRILSAKHGLVPLDRVLAPYDVTFGAPESITAAAVRSQAEAQRILDATRVIVLGSARYAAVARSVWPAAEAPMADLPDGQRGIGFYRGWLRRQRLACEVSRRPPARRS